MTAIDVDVAVVLGCLPGSSMLRSRCARAVRLIEERQARRLFLTGTPAEVADMRGLVRSLGGDIDVVVDEAARRTLDNIRHARAAFGDADVWLVTSRHHLPRALFLARHVGLRAHGVGDDGPGVAWKSYAREAVSWCGAVVDVVARRGW